MMKNVGAQMVSNLEDRGATFKFMWVNTVLETDFKSSFAITETPSFVILRPTTKKMLLHDEKSITEGSLKKLLDEVSGGDGKYKRFKVLPELKA